MPEAGPTPLSVKQVAARLNVATRTVYRLVEAGQLPEPVHIGASARWWADDVEKFLWRVRLGLVAKLPPEKRPGRGPKKPDGPPAGEK